MRRVMGWDGWSMFALVGRGADGGGWRVGSACNICPFPQPVFLIVGIQFVLLEMIQGANTSDPRDVVRGPQAKLQARTHAAERVHLQPCGSQVTLTLTLPPQRITFPHEFFICF